MISPCCKKETGYGSQEYQTCRCGKVFKKGDKKKDPEVEFLMNMFGMKPLTPEDEEKMRERREKSNLPSDFDIYPD
jgi:hypothetical protein